MVLTLGLYRSIMELERLELSMLDLSGFQVGATTTINSLHHYNTTLCGDCQPFFLFFAL